MRFEIVRLANPEIHYAAFNNPTLEGQSYRGVLRCG